MQHDSAGRRTASNICNAACQTLTDLQDSLFASPLLRHMSCSQQTCAEHGIPSELHHFKWRNNNLLLLHAAANSTADSQVISFAFGMFNCNLMLKEGSHRAQDSVSVRKPEFILTQVYFSPCQQICQKICHNSHTQAVSKQGILLFDCHMRREREAAREAVQIGHLSGCKVSQMQLL